MFISLDAGIEFTLSFSPFTHTHTHSHTHTHTHTYTHMYTHAHVHIRTHTYAHTVSWSVYWFQIIGQRDTNQMLEELGESKHLIY